MDQEKEYDIRAISSFILQIFKKIGVDVNDKHLTETPRRIGKMYINELFTSVNKEPPEITEFEETKYNQMIIVRDIHYYSMCSHHFLPFFGTVTIGYIPNGKIAGLSKFARVSDFFSKKPQVQERLTEEICDYVFSKLKPVGCGVVVTGRHMCMEMRGIKKKAQMVTTALRGNFLENDVKHEFLRSAGI